MSEAGTYTLILAKEDFKFSSAHFTLFGRETAELLHGHNYQVGVELSGRKLDNDGLLADFPSVKTTIRAFCERLDSKTLIPGESPHLQVREEGRRCRSGLRRSAVSFSQRRRADLAAGQHHHRGLRQDALGRAGGGGAVALHRRARR